MSPLRKIRDAYRRWLHILVGLISFMKNQVIHACPCGQAPRLRFADDSWDGDNRGSWVVECRCGNKGTHTTTEARAIGRWNARRSAKAPQVIHDTADYMEAMNDAQRL